MAIAPPLSLKDGTAALRVSEFYIPQFLPFNLPPEWNLKNLNTIFQISVSPYPKGKNKGSPLKATREGATGKKKISETLKVARIGAAKVSEFFKFH